MKFYYLLLCSVCVFVSNSSSQTWSTLGLGMMNSIPLYNPWVSSVITYHGEIYAAGLFENAGGSLANNIAKWNGTSWISLGVGVNDAVQSMAEYNGDLYVAGSFSTAGSTPVHLIAKWDGLNWSDVSSGIRSGGAPGVSSLAVYNGELYAGGHFDSAGSVYSRDIAKWNGTSWSNVTNWTGGLITCMYVFNNKLYIGSQNFDISTWDGVNMTSMNVGNHSASDLVLTLTEHYNELYVGGRFDSMGTARVNSIARWNGTTWSSLSTGMDHVDQQDLVRSLLSYNGSLFMGGSFSSVGGQPINNISKWDGSNWSSVGSGTNDDVLAFCKFNNDLYVGGSFTMAGSASASQIAKWNMPVSVEENNQVISLDIFPNPFSSRLKIVVNSYESFELIIYDISSRKLFSKKFDNSLEIETDKFPTGMFFYELRCGNDIVSKGKLIKD